MKTIEASLGEMGPKDGDISESLRFWAALLGWKTASEATCEIKQECRDKNEVWVDRGASQKLEEYGLDASSAIIIDKDTMIFGVCPSEETLKDTLREASL